MVTEQCFGNYTSHNKSVDEWDSWITIDNDGGNDTLSKVMFTLEPGQDVYVILSGALKFCGIVDLKCRAIPPPPPPLPSPPAPPPSPPVPENCTVDRRDSPTGGVRDICSIFGDPHVIEFKSVNPSNKSEESDLEYGIGFYTCSLNETFIILENDFFVILGLPVTFKDILPGVPGATLIYLVKLIYKQCAPDPHNPVVVLGDKEQFEEYTDPNFDTTIKTHHFNLGEEKDYQAYISVYIVTAWPGYDGICNVVCPTKNVDRQVRPPKSGFVPPRQQLLDSHTEDAKTLCKDQGINTTSPLYEACVFDLRATQDLLILSSSIQTDVEIGIEKRINDAENAKFLPSRSAPTPSEGDKEEEDGEKEGGDGDQEPSASPGPSDDGAPGPSGACSSSNETAVKFFVTMNREFSEVGEEFQELLQSSLASNIAIEFDDFLADSATECGNFVTISLYPGSVIAEVVVNLGSNASPNDVSRFKDKLDTYTEADVHKKLLGSDLSDVEVTDWGFDPPGESGSGASRTMGSLVFTAIAPVALYFLSGSW